MDDAALTHIAYCVGQSFVSCRDSYVALQEDQQEGWNLHSTLGVLGLGVIYSNPRVQSGGLDEEDLRRAFADL